MGLPSLPNLPDLHGPLAAMWRRVFKQAADVAAQATEARVNYHTYTYHAQGIQDYLTQPEGDARYAPIGALVNPMTATGDLIVGQGTEANYARTVLGATAADDGAGRCATPTNAIDDVDGTYAEIGLPVLAGGFVVDLGADRTIGRYRVRAGQYSPPPGGWPAPHYDMPWELASSLNQSTWTVRATGSILAAPYETVQDSGSVALAAAVTARYWRFRLPVAPTTDGGSLARVFTLELLGAGAAGDPVRLPAGANGQVLTADSTAADGLRWGTPAAGGGGLATDPLADAKGDLFAASADNAIGRVAVGTNGQALLADSTQTLGVRWGPIYLDPLTTKGDLVVRSATVTTRVPVGADGQVLTAASAQAAGVQWSTPAAPGMANPMTTLGDLITGGASGVPGRLGVGSAGQVLAVTGGVPAWGAVPGLSGYLPFTGGTLTGALVEQGASATANVQQSKLSTDTQPRFRMDASGFHEWGVGGTSAPDVTLGRDPTFAVGVLNATTGYDWQIAGTRMMLIRTSGLTVQSKPFYLGGGSASGFYPDTDNATPLGAPSPNRFSVVYAANGTIQTSASEAKTDVVSLDPGEAMTAVRATQPVRFTYKPPPPRPPQVVTTRPYDWRRARDAMVAKPKEDGARQQHGFLLDDPAYPCDPRFETGKGQSSPQNSVGLLLAAIKNIDARVSALGG